MDQRSQQHLTDQLLPAILAAARLELDLFEAGCAVERKADRSPVTEADKAAEQIILSALADIMPGIAVVSEEAFAAGYRPELTDPFILVDPLDGTKQFIDGLPEYTINVAVMAAGRPVYGLVYAPALADFMVTTGPTSAIRARLDARAPDPGLSLEDLSASPLAVRRSDRSSLVALQSRSRNIEQSDRFLSDYPVGEKRQLGSSYKFCLVACGEADLYPQLGNTYEWDTAAGEAIVLAAGGAMTDLSGRPLAYGKRDQNFLNPAFIASSAPLHALRHPAAG